MPNMPTFWYTLRRCGILKTCGSSSKLEKPSVPKKPCAGSSTWQPLQVWKTSDGMRLDEEVAPGLLVAA